MSSEDSPRPVWFAKDEKVFTDENAGLSWMHAYTSKPWRDMNPAVTIPDAFKQEIEAAQEWWRRARDTDDQIAQSAGDAMAAVLDKLLEVLNG